MKKISYKDILEEAKEQRRRTKQYKQLNTTFEFTLFEFSSEGKKRSNAAPKTGGGASGPRHPVPCPKPSLTESVEKEIKETMKLIIKKIQKQCDLSGNSARDIYLLSLALKELNQLEPTK